MKEAIKYTGLSRKKLLFFIEKGDLPFVDISEGSLLKRYRFPADLLDTFISNISQTKKK